MEIVISCPFCDTPHDLRNIKDIGDYTRPFATSEESHHILIETPIKCVCGETFYLKMAVSRRLKPKDKEVLKKIWEEEK